VAVLALSAAAASCRSAGPKGGVRPGQAPADPLRSYVGQTRLLAGRGDEARIVLKKSDLGRAAGGCDVAVEVKSASFDHGTAQFSLDALGSPRLSGRPALAARRSASADVASNM